MDEWRATFGPRTRRSGEREKIEQFARLLRSRAEEDQRINQRRREDDRRVRQQREQEDAALAGQRWQEDGNLHPVPHVPVTVVDRFVPDHGGFVFGGEVVAAVITPYIVLLQSGRLLEFNPISGADKWAILEEVSPGIKRMTNEFYTRRQ